MSLLASTSVFHVVVRDWFARFSSLCPCGEERSLRKDTEWFDGFSHRIVKRASQVVCWPAARARLVD